MIVGVANYFLRFEDYVVGTQWLKQFLKCNSKYHVCKQNLLAVDHKYSYNIYDISNYFEKVECVISEKGITDLDVWYMDEISYWIRCRKAELVVTMDSNKSLRMIDQKN